MGDPIKVALFGASGKTGQAFASFLVGECVVPRYLEQAVYVTG